MDGGLSRLNTLVCQIYSNLKSSCTGNCLYTNRFNLFKEHVSWHSTPSTENCTMSTMSMRHRAIFFQSSYTTSIAMHDCTSFIFYSTLRMAPLRPHDGGVLFVIYVGANNKVVVQEQLQSLSFGLRARTIYVEEEFFDDNKGICECIF